MSCPTQDEASASLWRIALAVYTEVDQLLKDGHSSYVGPHVADMIATICAAAAASSKASGHSLDESDLIRLRFSEAVDRGFEDGLTGKVQYQQ